VPRFRQGMHRYAILILGGLMVAAPSAAPASTGGGAYVSPAATIASVACRQDCADARTARPGGFLRLKGTTMKAVSKVTFVGGPGPQDDVTVPVAQATPRSVVVQVPANAASGRLRLRNADGALSAPSRATIAIEGAIGTAGEEEEPLAPAVPDRDTADMLDAHVDANTVFYDGYRKATFRYTVTAPAPLEVTVELRGADGAVFQRWSPGAVAPGAEQKVDWDGTAGGDVVPGGKYEFRVFAANPTASAAQAPGASEPPLVADSFRFLDHKFPIRGKHHFGEGAARFGAGRGGYSHEGQDVFANCGTPLVAARGGTVRHKAFHSRAGNYLVIDGDGTDQDYAYMHMQAPALVEKGDHVVTGQRIGNVGDTGRASGCHLHFELWTAPGWYEGGKPIDPLATLRTWDAQSG
jgi:murein DD-endopeptidase MepM/ murein hydrolase activator NlpD